MGGKKKKIAIQKIEKKDPRSVTFSKRRQGLYSKASQLCLLFGAKMAILATPLSTESHASFFSFGHSSVDSVVSAFLANQRPREEKEEVKDKDYIFPHRGLGFWWEDESLSQSDDPVKLRAAIDSISKMLNDLNKLRSEAVENRGDRKKDVNLHELPQTLNSANFNKNKEEHDQTVAISDMSGLPENFDGCDQKQDLELLSMQLEMDMKKKSVDDLHGTYQEIYQNKAPSPQSTSSSSSLCIQDDQILALSYYNKNDSSLGNLDGLCNLNIGSTSANLEVFNKNNVGRDQTVAIMNLDGCNLKQELEAFSKQLEMDFEMDDVSTTNQTPSSDSENIEDLALMIQRDFSSEEFDLDQFIDFDTNFTGLLMDSLSNQNPCSDSENTGATMVVNHKDLLDDDNLKISHYFNDLPSITTL